MAIRTDQDDPKTYKLSGPSQDELCLLEMVRDRGLAQFVSRDSTSIVIQVQGEEETYEIVKFFDFTSERKMMSIAVRRVQGNEKGPVTLYVKGADTFVKEKCDNLRARDQLDFSHADQFATLGLRTLAFAWRQLDDVLPDKVDKVERNLAMLGVTAVEDLLQENVAQAIKDFR
jgi:magnesium-transporting ATPase (P-type)